MILVNTTYDNLDTYLTDLVSLDFGKTKLPTNFFINDLFKELRNQLEATHDCILN